MAELQLSLLGKLQISLDGVPVSGFVSAKAQALLCYLAVSGRPHERETLAALFWGDAPETEARASLRTALANLRKLVGPHLDISGEAISFNRHKPYWLDVELFQTALATAGLKTPKIQTSEVFKATEVLLAPLRQAVELYRGAFLEGFSVREALSFEEWMLVQRERLRQQVSQGLLSLAKEHTLRGEYAAAIDYTSRLLALEPWREEGHQQMMLLLAKSGQRSAALAQYEACRRNLAEELGVEPAAETQALYERLKAAAAPHPHNLPPQATPFVGREAELARLADYLETPACRLLTLVGLGGVGKTRLALQSAAANLALFQDGVFFIALAAVDSPEALIAHLAAALNFSPGGPQEPKLQLLNYLRPKEVLLVLDNFEHLLAVPAKGRPGGADWVANILAVAPRLKIVTTSRERLNLQEEWVLEIGGLEFPDRDERLETTKHPFEIREERSAPSPRPLDEQSNPQSSISNPQPPTPILQSYSAIALFTQQARRVQPDFTLTDANQAEVIRLCRLLQGIPLGLELATTWLPVLSCAEIVTEIEHDLDFLATSVRNVPDRHRSMRAVFESSWGLLSEAERNVLKRLSVFQGGFQREAALQVAGASLPLLLGLLNKSLVRRDAAGRYDMHELIRQYAADKLAQSPLEKEQTVDRHCAYYAEFMQQRDERLQSAQQVETVREIEAELENIQVAWRRAGESEQLEALDKLAWGLGFFYVVRSRFPEGLEVFSSATKWLAIINDPADEVKNRVYAQVLTHQGFFCFRLTQVEQAEELLQKSLALLKQFGPQRVLALAHHSLGLIVRTKGQYEQARQHFEESLALAQSASQPWLAAMSRCWLGNLAYVRGEHTQAEQLLRQSLPVLRKIGKLTGLGLALNYLSRVALALGRPAEAKALLEESLALGREVNNRWVMALSLIWLSEVLNLLGEAERREAKQLLRESVVIFRELADRLGLVMALDQLGRVSYALAEYDSARRHLREALQLAAQNQLVPVTLNILVSLAELRLQAKPANSPLSEKEAALELLTLALNHPASEQTSKDRSADLLARLEADLPGPVIKAAWERVKTKELEAVVGETLRQLQDLN